MAGLMEVCLGGGVSGRGVSGRRYGLCAGLTQDTTAPIVAVDMLVRIWM